MKNILLLSCLDMWSLGKKKGAQSQFETIKGHLKHGFKVFYVNPSLSVEIKHKNFVYCEMKGGIMKRLNNFSLFKKIFKPVNPLISTFRIYKQGKRIIKENNIDLIYSYEVNAIPAGYFLKKKYNLPFVRRFQGTILSPHIKKPLILLRKYMHTLSFLLRSDLVVMTNDGTQGDKVLQFFNNSMNSVRFWRNGVSVPKKLSYKKSDLEGITKFDKNFFNILMISRLVNWKRVDRALKALHDLKTLTRRKVRLYIIGEGDEKKKLISLANDLKLQKEVKFLGAISHDKIKYYHLAADLFLSLYDLSNVGNPLLEALSYGKPIITLNNGDTGKIIKNDYNGVLLDVDKLDYLPKNIFELMQNKKKRVKLGKNAREYSLKTFWSWDERMDAEVNALESLFK